MIDVIEKLHIERNDILILRVSQHAPPSDMSYLHTLSGKFEMLGAIAIAVPYGIQFDLEKMTEHQAKNLYYALKARFDGSNNNHR